MRTIFKFSLIFAIALLSPNIMAFDVCDHKGFERSQRGWIRKINQGDKVYVDFKINIDELNELELPVTQDIAPLLAREAAGQSYYNFFRLINPPLSQDVDLIFGNTEAFVRSCWSKQTFGYRTPLRTFKWSERSSN